MRIEIYIKINLIFDWKVKLREKIKLVKGWKKNKKMRIKNDIKNKNNVVINGWNWKE
jgi:hypothetical protein